MRFLVLAAAAAFLLFSVSRCSAPNVNRNPTSEVFPSVQASALDGGSVRLPEDLAGEWSVLLVGYVQDAQFDCDRWILGLLQAQTPVAIREVPTIDGMIPGILSGRIDQGMRDGIPAEDWGAVLTVYDDADAIVQLTGKEKPQNARVLLLDPAGKIRWFHDRGYSAAHLLELDRLCREAGAEG